MGRQQRVCFAEVLQRCTVSSVAGPASACSDVTISLPRYPFNKCMSCWARRLMRPSCKQPAHLSAHSRAAGVASRPPDRLAATL